MTRATKPPAIIFDLDGTLIDSAPDLICALNHVLQSHNHSATSPQRARAMVGEGAAKLIARALNDQNQPPTQQTLDQYTQEFLAFYEENLATLSAPYPHAEATLRDLKRQDHTIAMCTNKPIALSEKILKSFKLSQFFTHVTGYDGTTRKPDPAHLAKTLTACNLDARDAILVGDSMSDALSAQAHAMPFVFVSYGYGNLTPDIKPIATIARLDELPACIQSCIVPP